MNTPVSPVPARWWLSINGETTGPHNFGYVAALFQAGKANPECLLCPEGCKDWKPAGEWPQFHEFVPAAQRWWVLIDGKAEGPFVKSEIEGRIASGDVSRETQLCPVSGGQWTPIQRLPEFAIHFSSTPPVEINGPLPHVADWIRIYGMYIKPVLWLFFTAMGLMLMVAGQTFLDFLLSAFENCLEIGIAVTLWFGAFTMRRLDKRGPTILLVGFGVSVAAAVLMLMLSSIAHVVAPTAEEEPLQAVNLMACFALPLFFTSWIFEVFALVWLAQNRRFLLRSLEEKRK